MIDVRHNITIERRAQLEIPLKPDGNGVLIVRPRQPRQQYITLVLGTVDKGWVVNPEDILLATRKLLWHVAEGT